MPDRSPQRRASFRRTRGGAVGPVTAAALAGLVGGLALVAGSLALRFAAAGASPPAAATGALIAVLGPAAAAVLAGAIAVSVLRAGKVASRDSYLGCAAGAAAPVWMAGQLTRLVDAGAGASAASGGEAGAAIFSPALWLEGMGWISREAAGAADVAGRAPGLEPVASMIGAAGAWVLLGCELLLVAGILCALIDRALAAPLCSACWQWCRRTRGAARVADRTDAARVVDRAMARDWMFFRGLGAPGGRRALRMDLARCPGCDRTSSLSIARVRPLLRDRVLVADLRMGPDDLRTVRSLADGATGLVMGTPVPRAAPAPQAHVRAHVPVPHAPPVVRTAVRPPVPAAVHRAMRPVVRREPSVF